MSFFCNEDSFLWKYIIGKKLEKGLREEEYKSYENKIEKEMSDLEKIKEFSWPEKNYIEYQQILSEQLEEIKNKINVEEKNNQFKEVLIH